MSKRSADDAALDAPRNETGKAIFVRDAKGVSACYGFFEFVDKAAVGAALSMCLMAMRMLVMVMVAHNIKP